MGPSRASDGFESCSWGQKGGMLIRNERSREQRGRMEEREVWVDVCERAWFSGYPDAILCKILRCLPLVFLVWPWPRQGNSDYKPVDT